MKKLSVKMLLSLLLALSAIVLRLCEGGDFHH